MMQKTRFDRKSVFVALAVVAVMGTACGATEEEAAGGMLGQTEQGLAGYPLGYLGCYVDGSPRQLPYYMGDLKDAEGCKAIARSYGFRYAGTQYGGQCFIGPSLTGTKVADSECTMPCDINHAETCGNAWRNSVYDSQVGVYQGCFTDGGAGGRALPVYLGDMYKRETCVEAAASLGYKYAGLQYFGQCFAGNSLGFTQVADSECSVPCDVDHSQTCGNAYRNQIYSTGK